MLELTNYTEYMISITHTSYAKTEPFINNKMVDFQNYPNHKPKDDTDLNQHIDLCGVHPGIAEP